jgi:hypothetical protein
MADDFLSSIQQLDARVGDLEIKLPFLVRDARIIGIYFTAPVRKIRKLLPGKDFSPVQILPGISMVQLTAYEFHDTDIGPYNDFSVVIQLNSPRYAKIPVYNFLKSNSSNERYNFLLHRGANSEEAVRVCKDHFHFPEFLASIEFSESDDWLTCEVKEGEDLICRLRGRKIPTQRSDIVKFSISTPEHQQAQPAEINFKRYGFSRNSSDAELTLGLSHPIARELSETIISTKPRVYVYASSCQFIL